MPNPIPFPPNNSEDELKNAKDIYPIMEFPAYEYPAGQCCVELDNKLYFLGGQLFCEWRDENHWLNSKVSDACYTDSVYTLDISSITADTVCNLPSQLLKPAPPMASGKPKCYAFAACGKIYALAGSGFVIRRSISRFEEFDPVKNEWKCLPTPSSTWRVRMVGHAVVSRKVFLSSLSSDIYASGLWSRLAKNRALAYNFRSTAVFVDDVLYAWMYRTPVAFSKAKTKSESNMEEDENKDFQLFDQRIFLSSEMEAKLRAHLPAIHPSVALAYLGDNMLCLVRTGSPVAVEPGTCIDPSMRGAVERRNISIHVFEPFIGDTYVDGELTYYRAEFLHSAHFVARARGAFSCAGVIMTCHFVSSLEAHVLPDSFIDGAPFSGNSVDDKLVSRDVSSDAVSWLLAAEAVAGSVMKDTVRSLVKESSGSSFCERPGGLSSIVDFVSST
ncbi:hypothetical protein RJ639_011814 [Escallonia herrerae]|uniref:Uncharacterized protein n=1 Tax=Escallonia herrerae TaxID=1293975 RepID=A0AA89AN98_9ASTE|nr:hypothetical protein RJ639_011814 [Escallonia herrerae]